MVIPVSRNMKRMRLFNLDNLVQRVVLVQPPRAGWISAVRQALGMSQAQLANRLSTTQQAVDRMEDSEIAKHITLGRLQDAAEALDSRLIYAFVPREYKTYEEMLRQRSRLAAERLVERVENTMSLENQSRGKAEWEISVAEIAEDLFRAFSRTVWDEPTRTQKGVEPTVPQSAGRGKAGKSEFRNNPIEGGDSQGGQR